MLNSISTKAAKKRQADSIKEFMPRVRKPSELKSYLDDYVVGQEQAQRVLAVAVHNHYKRLKYLAEGGAIASAGWSEEEAMCC